ncbi:diaminopropionate ammonia-lyase [Methyloligella sp. 2.7D]|uniref:diaminopropionate ammonia-lyase n=1 Tax=unclassified Methyloligella TaxID=2625955 RepID=UPI00157DEB88|nr:diaminopropionate ammonia-lyase [Methyloligella sp. GL2]QKP78226.1 diaminopropionate ammonia-lyase [Methyloligella sp. GL2]
MLLLNTTPDHNQPLETEDAATLSAEAATEVERYLTYRPNHAATLLRHLPGLAEKIGIKDILVKDESTRLGLGSFKALGGSYAVIRLVLEEASRQAGATIDISELQSPKVRQVAGEMAFGCATDGNHGKSVAMGAKLVGAKATIFVHSGVSDERVEAIASYGADIIRVPGNYDDSVAEAEKVCAERGWIVVSDTSWPGYERIPALVMQGYTAMLSEAAREMTQAPTHIFMQAGVGGLAAAVAGYFAGRYGESRPTFVVVEPDRAACVFESAKQGRAVKIDDSQSTIMAMLECYEPSLVAWRVLSRCADAFQTIGEEDAKGAMRTLAAPVASDPAIVSGESGGAGLAGLLAAMEDEEMRKALKLGPDSRVFLINSEGATDQALYQSIVGRTPEEVLATAVSA